MGASTSYKLAKYASVTSTNFTTNTTIAKVGLLRLGELMTGQVQKRCSSVDYWLLTQNSSSSEFPIFNISNEGISHFSKIDEVNVIRPVVTLNSNVEIMYGNGTRKEPFELKGIDYSNIPEIDFTEDAAKICNSPGGAGGND